MTDILTRPEPQTKADYEAAINQMLAEMQRLNEQMQRDQLDIDHMKAQAAEFKAESERYTQEHHQWKAEMERLRCEGAALDMEIRAALDRLKTTVEAC